MYAVDENFGCTHTDEDLINCDIYTVLPLCLLSMIFDLADSVSTIYLPPASEAISLSQRPQVRFGLCSSSSGLISSITSVYIYLLRPILHELNLKFQLFSQKLGNEQRRAIPVNLIPYISARRWKQRSVSEVELQAIHTIHQLGMNIQLGKFFIKENDFSGKSFFLLRNSWNKSGNDLVGAYLVSLLTSQDTLLVYSCNSSESGLVHENFPHHLYFDSFKSEIIQNESNSQILWTDSYQKIYEKINYVSITSADLSSIFIPEDAAPYLFLCCGMKDGRLLIWKVNRSNMNSFEDYELIYEKNFHSSLIWINLLCWSDTFTRGSANLAICSTDGTIDIITLNNHNNEISTCNLYNEQDGAVVKAILWEIESIENSTIYLFLIKGSYLFMFTLSLGHVSTISLENQVICANISHTSAVVSLRKLLSRYVVVGYVDCKFAIYEYQSSYLKQLTRESNDFSKFIHEYFVRLTFTNFLMLSFTFSPNDLFIILLCMGPLIGCGRPSKFDISLKNKIFIIPIISNPIVNQNLQPIICEFLHWDLTKLYLFYKTHQTCKLISSIFSSLPDLIKKKLEYTFNYLNCCIDSAATVHLLTQFNSFLISITDSAHKQQNELHNCLIKCQQNLLNPNFDAAHLQNCEVCGSSLTLDFSNMCYNCVNDHKSDFCIFTLKRISLNEKYVRCVLCRKKVLKTVVNELCSLVPKITKITCPLCDGFFIDS